MLPVYICGDKCGVSGGGMWVVVLMWLEVVCTVCVCVCGWGGLKGETWADKCPGVPWPGWGLSPLLL